MSSDLISREPLLKEVRENRELYESERVYLEGLLLNAPTVETEITEKQAICYLIKSGWLVNHDKELREKWERPQDRWGKWSVSEIQCPNCLEYFQTDCYSKEELNKCPICGTELREGAEQ